MILCVCLNPAVDVTYHLGRLTPGATLRVGEVSERAGGKGVNVARVLHALGEPVRLVAPAGDATGEELRRRLDDVGLPTLLVPSGEPTRRTVTVVESTGEATTLLEPGRIDCWPALLAGLPAELAEATVMVVSGGIPEGVPSDGLPSLVLAAHHAGVPVLVDTHGVHLIAALEAGADLVTPNAEELADVTGDSEGPRSARTLADRYAATVVASFGSEGVVAATPAGTWEARPSAARAGNPTGAGDALAAGLARALALDPAALRHPEEPLRAAVALATAAVRSPVAGEVDPRVFEEELTGVTVRALGGVR